MLLLLLLGVWSGADGVEDSDDGRPILPFGDGAEHAHEWVDADAAGNKDGALNVGSLGFRELWRWPGEGAADADVQFRSTDRRSRSPEEGSRGIRAVLDGKFDVRVRVEGGKNSGGWG